MTRKVLVAVVILLAACGAKKAKPDAKAGANAATAKDAEKSTEPTWLLHDNGKRCIVAPCPSWTAVNVDSRESVDVAGLDLSALKLGAKEESEARGKVQSGQTWARGTIGTVEKMGPGGAGQVLKVTALVDATGKITQPAPAPR